MNVLTIESVEAQRNKAAQIINSLVAQGVNIDDLLSIYEAGHEAGAYYMLTNSEFGKLLGIE